MGIYSSFTVDALMWCWWCVYVCLSVCVWHHMVISSDFSPTKKKMQHVANISIAVMYIMYFLAALFGYLTFYGEAWSSSHCGIFCRYLLTDLILIYLNFFIALFLLLINCDTFFIFIYIYCTMNHITIVTQLLHLVVVFLTVHQSFALLMWSTALKSPHCSWSNSHLPNLNLISALFSISIFNLKSDHFLLFPHNPWSKSAFLSFAVLQAK